MPNIIIAVNVIFVVCLDRREAFLSAFQNQVSIYQRNHDASLPSLIQSVLGEDQEASSTFHCHLKFQCSSLEDANATLRKEHPIFLNGACGEWKYLESSNPFQEEPQICVWRVADSSSETPNPKPYPKDQPVFCLNANLHIQPKFREEFLKVMENARSNSILEPLCGEYQYGESLDTPNTFHVHQEYIGDDGGKEGFDLHAETPHYQLWRDFSDKEPFTEEPMGYPFRAPLEAPATTDNTREYDVVLLDGGNGHELKQRGVITDGSFLAGLLANEQQPAKVHSVHHDFCQSGCQILTTNSFVAVPQRIQQDLLDGRSEMAEQRTRELIVAAVQRAQEVTKEGDLRVQVAGTVPPLTECYMPVLVPKDANDMVSTYIFLLSVLIEAGVDNLLAETLSTSREAIAILRAFAKIVQTEDSAPPPPLAISLTIDDFQNPTTLRSGERLDLAVESILLEAKQKGVRLWGVGVNCASPGAVTNAIGSIKTAIQKSDIVPTPRIMAYANAFRTSTSEWLASLSSDETDATAQHIPTTTTEEYDSQGVMLPGVYATYAKAWQDSGVSVIGGCCGCSPAHMKAVALKLAKAG